MTWEIYALGSSLATALYASINQKYRLPGHQLIMWRGLVPAVILGPFLLFVSAPVDPLFYLFVAINAVIVRFYDMWFFETVARFGAGLPLRLNPITVIFIFFTWLIFDPAEAALMLRKPWQFFGIALSLGIGLIALSFMTKCRTTAEAMRFYLPCLAGGVLIDIFNKKAMHHASSIAGPLYYAAIISFLVFLLSAPAVMKKLHQHETRVELKATYIPGMLVGVTAVGLMLFKNMAMGLTPNPAYVSAIIMASPLWLSFYARLMGKVEPGRTGAWLVFLASTIVMVILVHGVRG